MLFFVIIFKLASFLFKIIQLPRYSYYSERINNFRRQDNKKVSPLKNLKLWATVFLHNATEERAILGMKMVFRQSKTQQIRFSKGMGKKYRNQQIHFSINNQFVHKGRIKSRKFTKNSSNRLESCLYSIENRQMLQNCGAQSLKELLSKRTEQSKICSEKENILYQSNDKKQLDQKDRDVNGGEASFIELMPQSCLTGEQRPTQEIKVKRINLQMYNRQSNSFSSEFDKKSMRNRSYSHDFQQITEKGDLINQEKHYSLIEQEQFKIFSKNYIYVGQLNPSGDPHGSGQLYHFDQTNQLLKIFIQAEFSNGQIQTDDCIIIFLEKIFYRGGFYENSFHGKGLLSLNNGFSLGGNFHYGYLEGKGRATYPDGGSYDGAFKSGIREGKGKMIWKSQNNNKTQDPLQIVYEGFFQNDKMNGLGYLKTPNYQYWGPFFGNMKEGKGTIKFKDGKKFEGWFEKDQINGYGELHYPNGFIEKGVFPIQKQQN